jgi:hypothetical protein
MLFNAEILAVVRALKLLVNPVRTARSIEGIVAVSNVSIT